MDNNTNTPLIEIKNCTMEFPGVKALDGVNFTLRPGECHALVGENGAGKSTLSKCIIGENHMTQGEMYFEGRPVKLSNYSIKESQALGIAIVHQEFQLMQEMTGVENIFTGHYDAKLGLINWKKLEAKAQEILDFLQCDVDLSVPVKLLRTAEKQIIQLAKALLSEPKVLILDELTAVLQEKDINNIFRIIRLLKQKNIGVIYISHRLDEILQVCDAYTVLCDGKFMGSGKVADIDKPQLIKLIIGRELVQAYPEMNKEFGDVLLEVQNFTSAKHFRNINIQLREGEVIGIAGLVGAGKTEFIQALYGNQKITDGKIFIKGKPVKIKNPRDAIRHGFGFVPDERRALGLNMLFDIKDNTILPNQNKFRVFKLFQNHAAEAKSAFDYNEKMNLTYHSLWQNVKKLSGGNQQKIVIAKWMMRESDIFLLDEPTRGIDVGAKFEIYSHINDLTKQGKGVVLVSPELEELIGLCNKIYIMFEGSIMDVVEGSRKTQEEIIHSLLGADKE